MKKRWAGTCTAQCKLLLFCVKAVVKGSFILEPAHLKQKKKKKKKERKKERKHFVHLVTPLFSTFVMLFCATRLVVDHENN